MHKNLNLVMRHYSLKMNSVFLRKLNLEICTLLKFTKEGRKYKQLAVKVMNVAVVWPYTEM